MTRHTAKLPVIDLRLSQDDTTALTRALRDFADATRDVVQTIAAEVGKVLGHMRRWARVAAQAARDAANDEVHVAGIAARYLVRAGQDPAYRFPAALEDLVRQIMRGDAEETLLLTQANRAVVASSALHGWVHSYPGPLPRRTWDLTISGVHVVVTRG